MQTVLPMVSPPLFGLTNYVYMLSIVLTHRCGYPWFYENYLSFCSYFYLEKGGPKIEANFRNLPRLSPSYIYDYQPQQKICPLLNSYEFDQQYILDRDDAIDFVKYYIDRGCYLSFLLNGKYSVGRPDTNLHDALVYGYNDVDSTIYMAEFSQKGFGHFTIPYSRFVKALRSAQRNLGIGQFTVDHVDYKDVAKATVLFLLHDRAYEFDQGSFRNKLQMYLAAETPQIANIPLYRNTRQEYWGLSSYHPFDQYLYHHIHRQPEDQRSNLDIRHFHILYEHKRSMRMKVEYMTGQGMVPDTLQAKIQEIEEMVLRVRNLTLKYNISFETSILFRMLDVLQDAHEREYTFLQAFLGAL